MLTTVWQFIIIGKTSIFYPNSARPETPIGPNLINYHCNAYVSIWNVVYTMQNNFLGFLLDIYGKFSYNTTWPLGTGMFHGKCYIKIKSQILKIYCRALPPIQLVAVAFGGKRCSTSHISSSMHHMDMAAHHWWCASKDKLTKYI